MATNEIKTYKIASIPGDGIGPVSNYTYQSQGRHDEIVKILDSENLESLQEILGTYKLEFTELDWGTARYKKTGKYMPADGLDTLKTFDAGLFGAVGAPGMKYSL